MPLLLRFYSLIIPKSVLDLWAVVWGLFNTETSQQEENIMGPSGFQLCKAIPVSYSIPSYKNKQM